MNKEENKIIRYKSPLELSLEKEQLRVKMLHEELIKDMDKMSVYQKENELLQQKVNQLEGDYKNEVEENLKLSELWRKSQEEKRQLKTNRDEAIEYLKYALDEEKETPSKHNDWRLDLLEILGIGEGGYNE